MGLNKNSTRYYSNIQEKHVAKVLNGKQNVNSGATKWVKGDCSVQDILIECKTVMTPKNSYTVKKDVLSKLKQETYMMGKQHCALSFNFEPNGECFYVLSEKFFKELLETYLP